METTRRHFQTALVAGLLLAAIILPSQAADVRGLARVGADFGGDTLVVARFTTGTNAKIKANEGFYLGGGISILNDAKKLSLDLTATWKYTAKQEAQAVAGSDLRTIHLVFRRSIARPII